MGFLRGLGLVIFSILLVLFLIVLIFASSFNTMLYPQVYQQAFEKSNIYPLMENQTFGSNTQFIKKDGEGMKNVLNELIINGLSYIRGESDSPNLTIEIDQSNLRGFFEGSVGNLSVCSYKQDPYGSIPCKPSEMNSSQYLDGLIESRNITILKTANVDLAKEFDKDNNLSKLRDVVKIYKTLILALIVLSFLMATFILLLKRKELRSGFRWLGTPLLISLLLGLFINFGKTFLINSINLPSELSMFRGSMEVVFNSVFGRIFLYSLILLLLGIIFWVVSFFIEKKKN